MPNHLLHLLETWFATKDSAEWVLGTIFRTEGPCYRKAGAMMLFNSVGQQLGMLSGGCLESDIQRHAKKVMQTGQPAYLTYDANDEDDLTFQLGIGCGGTIHIVLQPLSGDNEYLALDEVLDALKQHRRGRYFLKLPANESEMEADFILSDAHQYLDDSQTIASLVTEGQTSWLQLVIQPPVHLLICGGGADAQPMTDIASRLGWTVSIWDPRPANGRKERFMAARYFLAEEATLITEHCNGLNVDAAIIMTHNVSLDAAALRALKDSHLQYLCLLGPSKRKEQVVHASGVNLESLPCKLAGPAGLELGGALPEGIALSVLSECMAALNGTAAKSLSGVLEQ